MRAIVITKPGGPEVLQGMDRPQPEPGLGQIRVRVHASALNRADIHQREGRYPAPPGWPTDIPGMEYAGEVEALGASATLWPVGARVMGIAGGGTHAEYVCVHEREAIQMPTNLSFEEAAAVPEAFLTAYDALIRQVSLSAGERLLIHAVGSGVGTAALQVALVAGAIVIGTSRTQSKLDRAKELGLQHPVNITRDDWPAQVREITSGKGIDAILDLIGGAYFASSVDLLELRGRLILVGLTAGRSAELNLGMILNKRAHIVGTVLRSRPTEEKFALAREFSERTIPLFESNRLRPVIDRVFPFSEIGAAHRYMESNSNFGKIVLRWEK
ncbi:MAG: NAD(P)H-quinone oxidoreductase [Gemmatimonadaceae bacterium]